MKQIFAFSTGIEKKLLKDVLRIATVLLFVVVLIFFVNSLEHEEAKDWNQCPKE